MTSLRSKRPQIVALLAAQRIQTGTPSQTDYIDPKGYWCDPSGNIRRMGNEDGEQKIIATATEVCSEAEWKALCKALENAAAEKRTTNGEAQARTPFTFPNCAGYLRK